MRELKKAHIVSFFSLIPSRDSCESIHFNIILSNLSAKRNSQKVSFVPLVRWNWAPRCKISHVSGTARILMSVEKSRRKKFLELSICTALLPIIDRCIMSHWKTYTLVKCTFSFYEIFRHNEKYVLGVTFNFTSREINSKSEVTLRH